MIFEIDKDYSRAADHYHLCDDEVGWGTTSYFTFIAFPIEQLKGSHMVRADELTMLPNEMTKRTWVILQ